jgi:hypothetical protein
VSPGFVEEQHRQPGLLFVGPVSEDTPAQDGEQRHYSSAWASRLSTLTAERLEATTSHEPPCSGPRPASSYSGRADADVGDGRSGWEHPLEDLDDEFSAPARS